MTLDCKILSLCVIMIVISSSAELACNLCMPGIYNTILSGLEQCIFTLDSFVDDGLNPFRINALPIQYAVLKSPSTAMGDDGLSAVNFPIEESNVIPFLLKNVSKEPLKIRSSGVPQIIGCPFFCNHKQSLICIARSKSCVDKRTAFFCVVVRR